MLLLAFALLISFANADILPFISNGEKAEITEFPYLVSIQEINVHVCAGSLLSDRWILSSGRCFVNRILNELNIEYGNAEISPGPNGPNKAGISRIITHEDFNRASLLNDISLVESAISINTGFNEPFAKLAPKGSRYRSDVAAVHAGWGYIRPEQRTTSLHKASLRTLSFDECAEAHSMEPYRTKICAQGESVMCLADYGNPLLINGVVVGVASFRNGDHCESVEEKEHPTVFTEVSFFIDWIENNTGIEFELNMFVNGKS